jgi:hypothetical protein
MRTTNPIESTFASENAEMKKAKRTGTRKAGLAMAWRLLMVALGRWHSVNASHLVALVKAGVEFPKGETVVLQCDPEPEEPFMPIPWIPNTNDAPMHSCGDYLAGLTPA